MKNYFLLLIGLWLAMVGPSWSRAGQAGDCLGELPNGHINWSQNTLDLKGTVFVYQDNSGRQLISSEEKADRARRQITPILMQNLALIKIDADQYVSDLMRGDADIRGKLGEMATAAPMTAYREQTDGSVEIGVQMQLNGGFAQLILPSDIKQVDTIKAVSHADDPPDDVRQARAGEGKAAVEPDAYTGLIVDARRIGAKPALVPVLLAENGKEVYSPAFISREYAVHNGVCHYVQTLEDARHYRTGPKPMVVKGLRTVDGSPCDIVISNADASRLHGASAHLAFLKECRVVILLD